MNNTNNQEIQVYKVKGEFNCAQKWLTLSVPENQPTIFINKTNWFLFLNKQDALDFYVSQFVKQKRQLISSENSCAVKVNSLKNSNHLQLGVKRQSSGQGLKLKMGFGQDKKIQQVVSEFNNDESSMREQISLLQKELIEAETTHQARLEEKTETLKINIKYYGGKCQELIEAIAARRKYDPETGQLNTTANVVKQLGIDQDKIKFNKDTGEFEAF